MTAPKSELAQRLGPVVVSLRVELEVTRQTFGGEVHYVFRDPITSLTHSFAPGDYALIAALDGQRPLADIFQSLVKRGKLRREDEDSFYRLILKVHQARLANLPVPDHKSLYDNWRKRRAAGIQRRVTGFLFMQIPLGVPDGFLKSTLPAVRGLFTRTAFWIWLAAFLATLVLVALRWDELQSPLPALFDEGNLLFLWFSLIGLKLIHELGHGYATRRFGGQVPEAGVFLIVGTPSAYVDASSAWSFPKLTDRVIVGLAGMYFESWIAMAALVVWAQAPDTALGGMAYQIFLLAGLITIAFNANPLMRFDGYFILSDLLGIPNLRARAQAEVGRWFDRIVLGWNRDSRPGDGPRGVLVTYGVAASIYKVTLVLGICTMIATKFYWLGIAMMGFYLATSLGGSLYKLVQWLLFAKETKPHRTRGVVAAVLFVLVPLSALVFVEVGRSVTARGILESERGVAIRTRVPGEIEQVPWKHGDHVREGEVLVRLANHDLESQDRLAQSQLHMTSRIHGLAIEASGPMRSRTRADVELDVARAARAQEDREALLVRAPADGVLVELPAASLVGSFVKPGEQLARLESGAGLVVILLSARELADAGLTVGTRVECRPSAAPRQALTGRVHAIAPLGTREVLDEAFTQLGGGTVAVRAETGLAETTHFEVDIRIEGEPAERRWYGGSVIVKLPAESEPLHRRLRRALADFFHSLGAE